MDERAETGQDFIVASCILFNVVFLFSVTSESESVLALTQSSLFWFFLSFPQGQTCVLSFSCSGQEQICQCTKREPDRATGLLR